MTSITETEKQKMLSEMRQQSFKQTHDGNKEIADKLNETADYLDRHIEVDKHTRDDAKQFVIDLNQRKDLAEDNITAATQAIGNDLVDVTNMIIDKDYREARQQQHAERQGKPHEHSHDQGYDR